MFTLADVPAVQELGILPPPSLRWHGESLLILHTFTLYQAYLPRNTVVQIEGDDSHVMSSL